MEKNEKKAKSNQKLNKQGIIVKELSVNLNDYGFLAKNSHCGC